MMAHLSSNSALRIPSNDSEPAAWLASLARQALIAEAELTPKPGLVDRRSAGAHSDLSLTIMRLSAIAIEPYFREMASISAGACPTQGIREQLAAIGRNAERAMFRATYGSNSHKGAIWVLGLLLSAAAMQNDENRTAPEIAATARATASYEDRATPRLVSHGDIVSKRYGASGARGEALQGFPHVVDVGLPTLRLRRTNGATEHVARLDALLSIIARLDDTCLLYRGGTDALVTAKKNALAVEKAGGAGTQIGEQRLTLLDRQLLNLKVSPGGSADLLAATIFLDAIERKQTEVEADKSWPEDSHGAN
jgi:triphosphoribosyl-dephospho-CoA synthase